MLILGGRYGSIESKSGKSYIELEYEYAANNKKPLFAAVISDPYLESKVRAAGPSVIETAYGTLLQAFRETVTKKICRFFGDINELKLIVFESLSNFERNEGLEGWIQGSEVLDPKATLEEVSRLQAENASLRNRVEELAMLIASSSNSGKKRVVYPLSNDVKDLFINSNNDAGYILLYGRYMGAASMEAGNRNFINPENSPREEARWKAALDELLERRLVEAVGYKGETFRLTKRGYEVADEIEARTGNS